VVEWRPGRAVVVGWEPACVVVVEAPRFVDVVGCSGETFEIHSSRTITHTAAITETMRIPRRRREAMS
jgi:hypothetical protein